MRINYLLILLLAAGFASNVFAEKPKDMNVVNTPNVTVTNPQTSVTVDNETRKSCTGYCAEPGKFFAATTSWFHEYHT